MPRGGRRSGTPGANYANRSDLRVPVPTGLPYGEHQALTQAQAATPPARPPLPPTAPTGAPGAPQPPTGGPSTPGVPPAPQTATQAPMPAPPGSNHLLRPTDRPNEPVTAGIPLGPGPGPSSLGPFGQQIGGGMADMLNQAAQAVGSPTLQFLARQAQAQGQ